MRYLSSKYFVVSLVAPHGFGIDYIQLDSCKLLCHMEHTIDKCKLVSTTPSECTNLYWTDGTRLATVVDRVPDDHFIPITTSESVSILKVGKNGCEKVCHSHDACVENGSECKTNGVCLNLFWNRGSPVIDQMTTCYGLSAEGCNDGTPILCSDESLRPPVSPAGDASKTSSSDDTSPETASVRPSHLKQSSTSASSLHTPQPMLFITLLLVIPGFTRYLI